MKKIVFFLALAALTAGAVFAGYYPAFSINGDVIMKRTILSEARIEEYASQKLGEAYRSFYDGIDLEAGIMNALVADKLIMDELLRQFGKEELAVLENERLESLDGYGDLNEASRELYGISFEKLKELFLLPLVRRDILRSQFVIKNIDWEKWLEEALESADVKVFLPGFSWDKKEGAIKRE